ncbi:hypothetical protein QBC44DRAFT_120894 [Cladorrhinum sp. PSN332]|nr:hypothetical protein QBC44DRAFT_120894 [Cladorrhinum sp. PSN332]
MDKHSLLLQLAATWVLHGCSISISANDMESVDTYISSWPKTSRDTSTTELVSPSPCRRRQTRNLPVPNADQSPHPSGFVRSSASESQIAGSGVAKLGALFHALLAYKRRHALKTVKSPASSRFSLAERSNSLTAGRRGLDPAPNTLPLYLGSSFLGPFGGGRQFQFLLELRSTHPVDAVQGVTLHKYVQCIVENAVLIGVETVFVALGSFGLEVPRCTAPPGLLTSAQQTLGLRHSDDPRFAENDAIKGGYMVGRRLL